jgi:hypothetical protein
MGIVGDIKDHSGPAGQNLEASGKVHQRKTPAYCLRTDRQQIPDRFERRQHPGRVEQLVGTAKRRVSKAVAPLAAAAVRPLLPVPGIVEIPPEEPEVGANLRRVFGNRGPAAAGRCRLPVCRRA